MISKSVLKQYIDLQEEIKEVNERITKSKNRISEIEKEIDKLKCNKKMIQKRKEDFFTDDILIPETDIMIENLILFKSLYIDRIFTLNTLIEKISIQIREIKEFEQSINDYFIKKIFDLRIKQGYTWKIVSAKMGTVNSEENLRSMFNRYLKKAGAM